jgi:hypothetical protein
MRKLFLFLILLFFTLVFSEDKPSLKKSINFTQNGENGEKLSKEDFAGYHELKRWASFQNMTLEPDSKLGMIKDGICRMVPPSGLNFYLEADPEIKRKIYLFLDLTTYINQNNKDMPLRSLKIIVGGKLKKTVNFQYKVAAENPVRIDLEPSDIEGEKINIRLEPSIATGGRFWGIWDAFYSFQKE